MAGRNSLYGPLDPAPDAGYVDAQRPEPVGDHHPRLDRGTGGDDVRPPEMLQAPFGGEFR